MGVKAPALPTDTPPFTLGDLKVRAREEAHQRPRARKSTLCGARSSAIAFFFLLSPRCLTRLSLSLSLALSISSAPSRRTALSATRSSRCTMWRTTSSSPRCCTRPRSTLTARRCPRGRRTSSGRSTGGARCVARPAARRCVSARRAACHTHALCVVGREGKEDKREREREREKERERARVCEGCDPFFFFSFALAPSFSHDARRLAMRALIRHISLTAAGESVCLPAQRAPCCFSLFPRNDACLDPAVPSPETRALSLVVWLSQAARGCLRPAPHARALSPGSGKRKEGKMRAVAAATCALLLSATHCSLSSTLPASTVHPHAIAPARRLCAWLQQRRCLWVSHRPRH